MYSGMRMDADSALYDFPTFATVNRYVQGIQAAYNAGVDLNDVEAAALSFACGVAAQMDYSSEGSGTGLAPIRDALLNKFGWYSTDMFGGLSGDSYVVLQENMINRLPALLSLVSPDNYYGHMIVCDGYNTDGEYHLNFGWGASEPEITTDAWYHLPSELYPLDWVVTESMLNIRPECAACRPLPLPLDFYGTPGQNSDAQLLRIQANADGVQVNSITSPAGFAIALADEFSDHLTSLPALQAKQKLSILVQFRPPQAGGYYGTLAIHYNDDSVRYVILRGWAFDGGTQIPAGSVSGTWSADKSPYFVNGDIQVPQNASLTIQPGVKVFFTGPYGLTVGKKAKFTAQGTAVAPIEFTAWNRDIGWTGLRFINSGSDDVLSYCSLSWAKKTAGFLSTTENSISDANEADTHGGAIYCYLSDVTIDNCRLTNNLGDCGGAIYCDSSWLMIRNTLIANNSSAGNAPRCGGICANTYGTPTLENCTIVNNSPGGISAGSWDGMTVTNTIVWGNEMYQIQTVESSLAATFCDVQGGYSGSGNFSADPAFISPSAGPGTDYDGAAANWALQSTSPCINVGTNHLEPAHDRHRGSRPQGQRCARSRRVRKSIGPAFADDYALPHGRCGLRAAQCDRDRPIQPNQYRHPGLHGPEREHYRRRQGVLPA